jgi:hypothetical protein
MVIYRIWNRELKEYLKSDKSVWATLGYARAAITVKQGRWVKVGSPWYLDDLEIHEFTLENPKVHAPVKGGYVCGM